jgi:hypothetical protein
MTQCSDCATNQTRLDTLDSEYVTLCEAIDALRTQLAKLEYTVRNLQRLAQSVHGPEAGL